jgi:hypothetical protein
MFRLLRAAPLALAAASLLSVAAPLHAQGRAPGSTLVSLNPLGLPFKYVSGEVERKLSGIATIGGSVSFLDIDDGSYSSFEGKFRLYPNEEAFRGFSIGLAAGLTRVSEDITGGDRSETAPTIAVLADYNWLLGRSQRVLVGTGVGAKRIFGDDEDFNDINFAYPTVRFQIGLIF